MLFERSDRHFPRCEPGLQNPDGIRAGGVESHFEGKRRAIRLSEPFLAVSCWGRERAARSSNLVNGRSERFADELYVLPAEVVVEWQGDCALADCFGNREVARFAAERFGHEGL